MITHINSNNFHLNSDKEELKKITNKKKEI